MCKVLRKTYVSKARYHCNFMTILEKKEKFLLLSLFL